MTAADLEPPRALALHDVREGGRWTRSQRLKNAVLRGAVRCGLRFADQLPRSWLIGVLGWLGWLAHWASGKSRGSTRRALERAGLDPRLSVEVWRNAGRNLGRCLALRRAQGVSKWVDVDAESARCLEDAIQAGRGVVFISLHLGPFEWLAVRIAELWRGSGRGAPGPAILVRESYDPALDPLVDAHRLRHGLDVIHRGKPGASARILRSLKQGRPVGFLPDLGGRVRTELVDWLGGPRELPIGPLRIAQRTGAPLLLGYLEPRSGGGFTLRITRSEALSAASPAQALAQDLERVILKHPEHWLWMGRSS
ncbi:MAG: lysophospholipid acyltransferase family protein [Myxococcales bacterium]|nr:lysophospholipid acyltransferase family protein [Myxococcales bacterium]